MRHYSQLSAVDKKLWKNLDENPKYEPSRDEKVS